MEATYVVRAVEVAQDGEERRGHVRGAQVAGGVRRALAAPRALHPLRVRAPGARGEAALRAGRRRQQLFFSRLLSNRFADLCFPRHAEKYPAHGKQKEVQVQFLTSAFLRLFA